MVELMTVLNNVATFLREITLIPVGVVLVTLAFTLLFADKNEKIANAKKIIGAGVVGTALWVFLIPVAEKFTSFFVF